jgi:hypothetical protein
LIEETLRPKTFLTVNFGAYKPEMAIDFAYDCKQSPWLVWQPANYRQACPQLENKLKPGRPFGKCDPNDTLSLSVGTPGLSVYGAPYPHDPAPALFVSRATN